MAKIDWSYHRPGCKTCGKTQDFLSEAGIEPKETVDAKKNTLKETDALELVKSVNEIYSAKGKKIVHVNLKKEKPDDETLKKLLLGPTGNLRAPTLRTGKTLMVGFDQETYEKLFA